MLTFTIDLALTLKIVGGLVVYMLVCMLIDKWRN